MERGKDRFLNAARPSDLVVMLERMRDEHLKMKQTIAELEAAVERADRMPDVLTVAHEIMQGCGLLKKHFRLEEEVIMPLVEQMLNDSDADGHSKRK